MTVPIDTTADMAVTFLATTDRARAKKFYVNTLGLELVAEDDFALILRCGSTPLRISEVKELQVQPFTVLGWEVADIEFSARVLIASGIELIRYPGLQHDYLGLWSSPATSARICWFNDPDGNLLSLSQH